MSSRSEHKRGCPMQSDRVWIKPEPNEELDARKLSRAFLALALHQAADESAAREEHVAKTAPGTSDESA